MLQIYADAQRNRSRRARHFAGCVPRGKNAQEHLSPQAVQVAGKRNTKVET